MSAQNLVTSFLLPADIMTGTVGPKRLKLAILGDKQVGKTSLLTRYTNGTFNPTYLHTKGGDISEKNVVVHDTLIQLSIIDSAGHYYVRSLIKNLYRNVHGILIVYDVTREKTFDSINEWLHQISLVNPSDPVIMVVGNKNDLKTYKAVPSERAAMYAASQGVKYFEVSAKTGDYVLEAFAQLIKGIIKDRLPELCDSTDSLKLCEDNVDSSNGKHRQCCTS